MYQTPWGIITTGRLVPANKVQELPIAGAEREWFELMQAKGLADGYESHELQFEIESPLPPLCRHAQRVNWRGDFPAATTRTTRPDICRMEGNRVLFTELKSHFPDTNPGRFLETIWKLPVARRVISDYQIEFLLVFVSDKLIYSSLPRRQVRRILKKIGLKAGEWTICSSEELEARIAAAFPKQYPEGPQGYSDNEALPRAS